MTDEELQSLTEELSEHYFQKPFLHQAIFNPRLRTTGGRYMLKSHNIEVNKKYLLQHGQEELEGIIKHELCHYHLHLEGKGYQHRDVDFKRLLEKVGAPRHCTRLIDPYKDDVYKHLYKCTKCGQIYKRKRRVNVIKYVCGKCGGKLRKKSAEKMN